jgi:hypothetical protein
VYFVGLPLRRLIRARRAGIGVVVARGTDSLTDMGGARTRLLSRDSTTLVLLIDPGCMSCRLDARQYLPLQRWAAMQHVALRLLTSGDSEANSQFARLIDLEHNVFAAPPDYRQHFGIDGARGAFIVDARGVVRGRWANELPSHLAILNVLGRIDRGPTNLDFDAAPAAASSVIDQPMHHKP